MAADGEPVLSFVRPTDPYVCLGFHRDLAEVDTGYCAQAQLPVLRRLIGGGPVYLDHDQVFFQLVLPARATVGSRTAVLASLLGPAVAALRSLGVAAELDHGEIVVGPAKVCGHGAGQLRDGVAVVGNLILGFDHARASRVLDLGPDARAEVESLMRRYVHATVVDVDAWKSAMISGYAAHFGTPPHRRRLTPGETQELERVDALLGDGEFVAGRPRPARPVRTVKIRAGVWVHEWRVEPRRAVLSVADGVVHRVSGDLPADLVGVPTQRARLILIEDCAAADLAAAMATASAEVAAA
jgi:lipoate-protein ligase A